MNVYGPLTEPTPAQGHDGAAGQTSMMLVKADRFTPAARAAASAWESQVVVSQPAFVAAIV